MGTGLQMWASTRDDEVQFLQTPASLENLAISMYQSAVRMPFGAGRTANPVIRKYAQQTLAEHTQHATAVNKTLETLGGKRQQRPNRKYVPFITQTLARASTVAQVVKVALMLEDITAQTYLRHLPLLTSPDARQLVASIAGVEAQNKAILLIVEHLVAEGDVALLALPPDLAKLPAGLSEKAFPDSLFPFDRASPVDEGAVR